VVFNPMPASQTETLRFRRRFEAPREAVFRAWTDPKELIAWWAPKGYKTPFVEIDLRENGRYRIAMQPKETSTPWPKPEFAERRRSTLAMPML
jgi:uncharacterized protein YndB with AHSA1/START domain